MNSEWRTSVRGERRGPLCGMGICYECRDASHNRTCLPLTTSRIPQESEFDVIVVGSGPAGMAAASVLAEAGKRVAVVDMNPAPGGQIWRGVSSNPLLERFKRAKKEVFYSSQVVDANDRGSLVLETRAGARLVHYQQLILSTGARELFLPFPGWTLPNVTGAGGLQALAKNGLDVRGKRVVVAGSGPLLIAVAAYLKTHGAEIVLIAEQSSWRQMTPFFRAILGQPSKLWQGLALKMQLLGVPYRTSCWPVSAQGDELLSSVTLRQGERAWTERCDYLACGFGLVPNTELASLLGCGLRGGFVTVDQRQMTTVDNVYCAGEATGIGGVDKAVLEGEIAARALLGELKLPSTAGVSAFQQALHEAFALRDELKTLASPETIVCRCEDVTLDRISRQHSWRSAKLQTRCGMGPCQARVCGPAIEYLLGWPAESVRPPLFPTKVQHLC